MVSKHGMSTGVFRTRAVNWYSNITAAMPETMAENRNTTGISGDDHHGLALIEPKMKPTYPCSRKAEGMPISVTIQPTRSSMASERGLMLLDPSVITSARGVPGG